MKTNEKYKTMITLVHGAEWGALKVATCFCQYFLRWKYVISSWCVDITCWPRKCFKQFKTS